jgi:hypothetical protein
MQVQATNTVEVMIKQIMKTRRISRGDQQRLMELLLQDSLSPQEKALVTQMHETLRRGLLKVVD